MFVADRIPLELLRMAEFLNDQLTHTEVLALEVRQYRNQEMAHCFSAELKNSSATATVAKEANSSRRSWTEAEFVQQIALLKVPTERAAAEELFAALRGCASAVTYGSGKAPSFNPRLSGLEPASPVTLWADGGLTINYGYTDGTEEGRAKKEQLRRALGPLLGEEANTAEPRFPRYAANLWTPHVKAIIETLISLVETGE